MLWFSLSLPASHPFVANPQHSMSVISSICMSSITCINLTIMDSSTSRKRSFRQTTLSQSHDQTVSKRVCPLIMYHLQKLTSVVMRTAKDWCWWLGTLAAPSSQRRLLQMGAERTLKSSQLVSINQMKVGINLAVCLCTVTLFWPTFIRFRESNWRS